MGVDFIERAIIRVYHKSLKQNRKIKISTIYAQATKEILRVSEVAIIPGPRLVGDTIPHNSNTGGYLNTLREIPMQVQFLYTCLLILMGKKGDSAQEGGI